MNENRQQSNVQLLRELDRISASNENLISILNLGMEQTSQDEEDLGGEEFFVLPPDEGQHKKENSSFKFSSTQMTEKSSSSVQRINAQDTRVLEKFYNDKFREMEQQYVNQAHINMQLTSEIEKLQSEKEEGQQKIESLVAVVNKLENSRKYYEGKYTNITQQYHNDTQQLRTELQSDKVNILELESQNARLHLDITKLQECVSIQKDQRSRDTEYMQKINSLKYDLKDLQAHHGYYKMASESLRTEVNHLKEQVRLLMDKNQEEKRTVTDSNDIATSAIPPPEGPVTKRGRTVNNLKKGLLLAGVCAEAVLFGCSPMAYNWADYNPFTYF